MASFGWLRLTGFPVLARPSRLRRAPDELGREAAWPDLEFFNEIPPPATFRTSASGRPLIVRAGQAPAAATAGPGLQVDLLGKLQGVIELDAKVSHCAIQLAVTE